MSEYKSQINNKQARQGSIGSRLSILFGFFVIMLVAVSFCQTFIGKFNIDERSRMLLISILQSLFVFILPSYIMAKIADPHRPFRLLGLTQKCNAKAFAGILLVFIIGLPFLNQIVYWNQTLSLPESLKGVEEFFRTMENRAEASTEVLLGVTSVGGMISGILVIGILTGLSEEIIFRGALQNTLYRGGFNASAAIWLTAVIFSFMHFQFFGFVPRILLGAFFGFLFFWTGSLWVAIFAHALNNSLVVVSVWMQNNNWIIGESGDWGVVTSGFPFPFIISLILLSIFFIYFSSYFFFKNKQE